MEELSSLVEEMISGLERRSFDDLNSLPSRSDTHSHGYSFATWKDSISTDIIRVVVQGYKPGKFVVGRMYARGFRVSRSGVIEKLTTEEVYDFT